MSGPNQKKSGGKKSGKPSRKQKQPDHEPERSVGQEPAQMESLPPQPMQRLESQPSHRPEPVHNPEPQPLPHPEPEPLQSQAPDPMPTEPPGQHSEKEQVIAARPLDAELVSADLPAIDFQTIATAYGDYTKKSFAETKAYVEKLSTVRSIDKIVEIQTEFAKQAYETFITESRKIRELYSGLAKQNLKPFEGFVAGKNRAAR